MDETRIIRGRRVVFERKEPVETLRYSIDVFDAGDNLVEVLGRLADLAIAHAGFEAAACLPSCARCAATCHPFPYG